MKKSMMSVAVTAALLSMSAVQASEFKGAYIGANVGINHSKIGTVSAANKFYPGVQAGYNWDLTSNVLLGVEGFVDGHSKSVTGNDAGIDAKLGYTMGNFMPYARLGAAATTPGTRVHGGLGLEYKFAPSWSALAEVTADMKKVTGVAQRNTNFAIGVNYYFDKPAVAAAAVVAAVVAAPAVMKKAEPVAAPAPVAAPVAAPAPVVVAPVAAPVAAPKVFTLKGTNFATSSAKLMPAASKQMAEVLEYAKNSKENFNVVGHTDSRGSEKKNQVLSAARAASVKAYLVAHGVAAARITTSGAASTKPVGDNKTDAGRAENRRVEVTAVAAK
ncbi:MAG: OmpA family protein [Sideroxydans sp.]|nr:OmpA family protein [Sideroxydans sp.]